ncbi:ABC transporter permease subunit [Eggerthella sinensis]|uniref:Polar amino acid ABC transporter permease n=1 Tax=Eggerthella sinensis TaxID=242230 RepID=A0A3N0IZU7_9ACTN|nr:ABC transporter permease subunit [Eggerthella sinensis]RDB65924.1 polar amino acid ABC transporter permease [Eggerthella sinensis]RNM41852.1 polar amino acid ABC transporter permease [Eggerthella sinensis]
MLEIFAPYKWEALFERWPDILTAFGTTVGISVLALIIALALGIVFGVLSVSRMPVLRGITRVYVEVVQNVPLLLQVFVFYAIFPLLGLSLAAFWIGVLAIGIYHGGYISEVVRSGIGSIHRGQFEAAKSQGFSYWQSMFIIILPQAIRIIMPPLAVQAANLVKNTSVLALIAGGELMYFSNSFAGATSYYGPVYVVAALLYFVICFPLSRLALYLERRTRSHKHITTGDATDELAEDAMEVTPGTHDITGRAAADTMAGGVQTMYGTVDIAPARVAPSPRHPLHTLAEDALEPGVAPENPYDQTFTGNQAAEIADEIGREIAQEIADEYGDEEHAARAMRTKSGRVKAHRRLERRVAARRGVESSRDEMGAAVPTTPSAAAEGARDEQARRRSPEADEALASRAETVTSDRITSDVRRRVDAGAQAQAERERVRDRAELGEEAFMDNDYLPGELEQSDERVAQVRAPHDEADFDAEATDAVQREDRREQREERREEHREERRERREAREKADQTGGPQTVEPDDVRLDQEADVAVEDAEEAAETDERSMDVERGELADGEEAATTDEGREDR